MFSVQGTHDAVFYISIYRTILRMMADRVNLQFNISSIPQCGPAMFHAEGLNFSVGECISLCMD
jgi:hypothetical protein